MRTIVVTGASSGIGQVAADELRRRGHRVIALGPEDADFSRLAEVRALAARLDRECERIDVLANNAGGMFDAAVTEDGFDLTFQVDYLAPFLLTRLLLPKLVASRASVIQTVSTAARMFGHLELDGLGRVRDVSPFRAYGDAKVALMLLTRELHARFGTAGLAPVSYHPGVVATGFGQTTSSWISGVYGTWLARLTMRTPEVGAAGLVRLADGSDWVPGAYYERSREVFRVNPQVNDSALATGLWRRTSELLGLDDWG